MSSDCGICGNQCDGEGNEIIKCAGGCGSVFHSRCSQYDVVGTKTRSFKDWKCKNCRKTSVTISPGSNTEDNKELIKTLEEFKREIFDELKSTRTELNGLSEAVKFFSDKFDESTSLMKEIRNELATVKRENEDLRSLNSVLSIEVTSLKDRVRSLEQYSRKNNVEISGIPETPKENIITLVKDVGTAMGLEIEENEISTAHRVPSFKKDRPPPIIVQFLRRTARDTLLKTFKEKKVMTARQINAAFPEKNIYINEHLSPENKIFLSKLKLKCKEVDFEYAWCRDGKFFVRKCQGERCRRVDTYEELYNLK